MTTNKQMRYYRSTTFLGKIAKQRNEDVREAHEWVKKEFFKKSTTLFTDSEFEEKLSEIRSAMSKKEYGSVYIDLPNEDTLSTNYE